MNAESGVVNMAVPRVLICDDAPEMRHLVRALLRRVGEFQFVGEAEDGAMTVLLAQREQPDFIFLDVHMPIMNGLEAIPLIKLESPASRVVVISAYEYETAATHLGVMFVTKSQRTVEMISALQSAVAA